MPTAARTLTIAAVTVALLAGGAGPAGAAPAGPATPVDIVAGNDAGSIQLSWRPARTGVRASSFRVYEAGAVVARHTAPSVRLRNLGFGTTHTYTVTAVDARGRESAPSAPVTRRVWVGGVNPACAPPPSTTLLATEVTASAVALSWSPAEWPNPVVLRYGSAGQPVGPGGTTARVGGLAPGTGYTFWLSTVSCTGTQLSLGSVAVVTRAGPAARPGAPSTPSVTAATDTTVSLRWDRPSGAPAPLRYAVYEGARRVAETGSTAVTVRRLYHGQAYAFTVAAVDAAGSESAHSAVRAGTATCAAGAPKPVLLTAAAVSPSTVRLSWVQTSLAESFTVYDGSAVVATSGVPAAVLTGLPSGSRHTYRVSATLIDGCGETARSAAVVLSTPAGPAGRPGTPTGVAAVADRPTGNAAGSVLVSWAQPVDGEPVVGYRVYEDAAVIAETVTRTVRLTVPTNTRHSYTVTALDAAGVESPASRPATVHVPYLPVP